MTDVDVTVNEDNVVLVGETDSESIVIAKDDLRNVSWWC